MMAWKEFEQEEKSNASLMSTLTKDHSKQVRENRTYIKTVTLLLTATHNISQRGCWQTWKMLTILNVLGNQLSKKTDRNEILEKIAEVMRTSIIEEVKESEVFSLMADETEHLKRRNRFLLC